MSTPCAKHAKLFTMPTSVGRPVNRVEGVEKVTGRARYTADTPVGDVRYAALVQAEITHGRVTPESIAAAAARAAVAVARVGHRGAVAAPGGGRGGLGIRSRGGGR